MGRMAGKVAVIFGVGPNNGGTIAHFMAREGAKIFACDLAPAQVEDTVRFLRAKGFEAEGTTCNASVEADVARVVAEAVAKFGHVDTLVNLAGRQIRHSILDMTVEDWKECTGTYLDAGMLTTKHVARAMVEQNRKGCLIHVLSTAAHFGQAGNSAYSAAKAGLMNFARAAAMDLAHLGIRVNTLTPFAMEHNVYPQGLFGSGVEAKPTRYSFTREDVLRIIPMGRYPRATDLAHCCVFLASDEAEFLTGIDIPCDGGTRAKYPSWRPGDFKNATMDEFKENLVVRRYGEAVDP